MTTGCRTGRNYAPADAPRFAGAPAGPPQRAHAGRNGDTLLIVSFNIAFAKDVDSAIALLESNEHLRGADVLLLQEMDGPSTQRVANALGLWYVYYPAIFHLRTRRDFGNAVLSRWPIVNDARIVLPHESRYAGTQRTATAATIQVGDSLVRVYSTHLSTVADLGADDRRDQLRAIVDDAELHRRVIIGGDMNNATVGRAARDAGYSWPTEHGPRTTLGGRWDHIFLKGLATPAGSATGTLSDTRGVSDHRPIWTRAVLH